MAHLRPRQLRYINYTLIKRNMFCNTELIFALTKDSWTEMGMAPTQACLTEAVMLEMLQGGEVPLVLFFHVCPLFLSKPRVIINGFLALLFLQFLKQVRFNYPESCPKEEQEKCQGHLPELSRWGPWGDVHFGHQGLGNLHLSTTRPILIL